MRAVAALILLVWLATAAAAPPGPAAALEADLRAWLARPPGDARRDFAARRLRPWFDTEAMLWRATGLPPPRRRELAGAFTAFLLAGLERRLATAGPWTRRLAARAGGESLLVLAGRDPAGRPWTAGFALRRGPGGWRVVDVQLDGIPVVAAWCRRHGC